MPGREHRGQVGVQIALTPEAVHGVKTVISDKERVKPLGLKPSALRIDPSPGELVYDHRPLVRTKPADFARIFEALASLAEAGGPSLGDRCAMCHENPAGDVIVVNGLPTQLCGTDLARVRMEDELSQRTIPGQHSVHGPGGVRVFHVCMSVSGGRRTERGTPRATRSSRPITRGTVAVLPSFPLSTSVRIRAIRCGSQTGFGKRPGGFPEERPAATGRHELDHQTAQRSSAGSRDYGRSRNLPS